MTRSPESGAAARAAPWLCIAAATALFTAPALYSGYPLIWYDTGSHVEAALIGRIHWARSIWYSLFIAPLHAGISLWPVVFVQSAIVAALLFLVLRVAVGRVAPLGYLTLCTVLAVVTGLPWFTSWIMADVFTACVVLGLFLLAFGRERMSRIETIAVFALTSLAAAAHTSHVPLAAGLSVALIGSRALLERGRGWRARWALWPAGAAAAGAALVAGSHLVDSGRLSLAPYGNVVVVARFAADGPLAVFLDSHCRVRPYRLCLFRKELPMRSGQFLWSRESPLARMGGPRAFREEAGELVRGSLAWSPLWHARLALGHTAKQLTMAEVTHHMAPLGAEPDNWGARHTLNVMSRYLPDDRARYAASRQDTGAIRSLPLGPLHRAGMWLGYAVGIAALTAAVRRRDRVQIGLAAAIAVGLLANAFVTGALSEPENRYHARVAWLPWVAGAAALLARPGRPVRSARRFPRG